MVKGTDTRYEMDQIQQSSDHLTEIQQGRRLRSRLEIQPFRMLYTVCKTWDMLPCIVRHYDIIERDVELDVE